MKALISVGLAGCAFLLSLVGAQGTVFRTQPKSQSTVIGGSVAFTVDAGGYTPLQWVKVGLNGAADTVIAGATNTSYTVRNVSANDAGGYYVEGPRKDPMDMFSTDDNSDVASLMIDTLPVFDVDTLLEPSKTVRLGSSNQVLSAWATGGDLSYIWTVGSGTANVGGASGYYDPTVCVIDTTHDGVFLYKLTVTNLAGSICATSVVTVVGAPGFKTNLTDKTVALGSNWTFSVNCTNTAGAYRWYFNGTTPLVSATNSYTVKGATTNDAGTYSVVLSNLAGSATSYVATLTVLKPPTITTNVNLTNLVALGRSITNAVVVDGGSLSYQWYYRAKSGAAASAAASTSNTLIIPSVGANASGIYYVVVTNALASVTSSNWYLTVIPPPAITTAPKAQSLTNGQTLTLKVVATGTKPYTNLLYQWTFNATNNLAAATNASLVISNAVATNAGSYAVVITNFGGSTTSTPVTISVGADSVPPVLKITDPSKTNVASTNAVYNLKGTATDNVSVTNVAFSLDGSHYTNATTTNAWAKWSVDVPLQIGSNTVWVQALDYSSNSTISKVQIFYAKWMTLTITNAGTGTGSLTGPSNAVQFGSNYVLTAKADTHNKFIKWVGWSGMKSSSTNAIVTTTNVIKFTVTNNVVLTNEFDTNLFWNAAGTYNGLINSTNPAAHTNVGFVTATVTTNLTYSGKVLLAGQTMSISGSLDTNGAATIALPVVGVLSFKLGSQQLSGFLYDTTGTNYAANFLADIAYYSKTNPTTSFDGTYTIAIPTDTNGFDTNGFITKFATNGFGYGTVNVSTNGTITFSGVAADGQVVSQSVPISQDGDWPLFAQMYTVNKTNATGELVGWLKFATNGVPTGKLAWIKSQSVTGVTNYVNGITNVSSILSSGFTAPTADSPLVITNLSDDLGVATFNGGGMTNKVSTYIFVDQSGTIYSYNTGVTLKVAKTGLITGKFPYNNNTKALTSFTGVILQNSASKSGLAQYGTFLYGTFSGGGVSGSVVITTY